MLILARIFHDVFTVVWIGGLITIGITVLPTVKKITSESSEKRELKSFTDGIQKRMGRIANISIIVLLLTGIILARSSTNFHGLFSFRNSYSALLTAKHVLFAAMILVMLIRKNLLKKPEPSKKRMAAKLFFVNLILGTAVVIISSVVSMFGKYYL